MNEGIFNYLRMIYKRKVYQSSCYNDDKVSTITLSLYSLLNLHYEILKFLSLNIFIFFDL